MREGGGLKKKKCLEDVEKNTNLKLLPSLLRKVEGYAEIKRNVFQAKKGRNA